MDNIIFSHYLITLVFFLVPGYIFVRFSRYILSYYKRTLPEIIIHSIISSFFIHLVAISILLNFGIFKEIYLNILSKNVTFETLLNHNILLVIMWHFLLVPLIFIIIFAFLAFILQEIKFYPKVSGDVKHIQKMMSFKSAPCIVINFKTDSKMPPLVGILINMEYKEKILTLIPLGEANETFYPRNLNQLKPALNISHENKIYIKNDDILTISLLDASSYEQSKTKLEEESL